MGGLTNETAGPREDSQPAKSPSIRPRRGICADGASARARAGVRSAVRSDPSHSAHFARWAGRYAGPLDRRSRRPRDRPQLRHGAARRRRWIDRRRIRGARCTRRQHIAVRHRWSHHAAWTLCQEYQVRRGEGLRLHLPDQRIELRHRGRTRSSGEIIPPPAGAFEKGPGKNQLQQHGGRLDPAPDRRGLPGALRREVDARAISGRRGPGQRCDRRSRRHGS